jgi:excisionase family DNA binding protein
VESSQNIHQKHIEALAVSPAEAARLMGIGRTHIYKLINSGLLRRVRLGNRTLIPVEAIKDCLSANEVKS